MATNEKVTMPQCTTGRNPLPAAPRPIPVKAASEMGVKRTLLGPNAFSRACARRVAIVMTRSSRCISSIMASSSACAKLISLTAHLSLGEHVDQQIVGIGIGTGLGEIHRRPQIVLHPLAQGGHVGSADDALVCEVILEAGDRIPLALAPLGEEGGRSRLGGRGVPHGVEEPPERLAVE